MNNTNNIPSRKVFTDTLLEYAKENSNIVVLTSDSRGSVTLDKFADTLPQQFIEVGIAEQNLIGIAAGIATCGKIAFACSPACFLSSRSLEQIKIDVAYSNTNVKIIGVSGGISYGSLGLSHHSLHDIAVMRAIPGITIILPSDTYQTKQVVKALLEDEGPAYIRIGRNPVPNVYSNDFVPFKIGKANILLQGNDITIISTGEMLHYALKAGRMLKEKGINARVIDMHTIKPLDTEVILAAAKETKNIITVEEHSINGGLGAAISEFVTQNYPVTIRILGIPDQPTVTGSPEEVFRYYKIDSEGIYNTAIEMLEKK